MKSVDDEVILEMLEFVAEKPRTKAELKKRFVKKQSRRT